MKNRKTLCLIISLVLVLGVALPGTLATAISTDDTSSTFSVGTEENQQQNSDTPLNDVTTDSPSEPVNSDTPTEAPKTPENTEGTKTTEGTTETTEAPESTEGTTEPTEAPTEVTEPPTEPEKESGHIDTCTEDCTDESCECGCHLFDRLMACTTIEEMDAIFASAEDALLDALTDEQWEQIDAHYAEIAPAPIPALPTYEDDAPVTSEIVYVTKNYDNVAPFVGDAG